MSTSVSAVAFRKPIEDALARRAGRATDAGIIAAAVLDTWRDVTVRLAPIIGSHGVDVLFRRALHLVSATYTWLVAPADGDGSALLADLKGCLVRRDAASAGEAGLAVMLTAIQLLADLIGESLTERLLTPVWALGKPPHERETTT
jgi:hypothetical protein